MVDEEDGINETCDLVEAFRRYFAVVTPEEIEKFKQSYVGELLRCFCFV